MSAPEPSEGLGGGGEAEGKGRGNNTWSPCEPNEMSRTRPPTNPMVQLAAGQTSQKTRRLHDLWPGMKRV